MIEIRIYGVSLAKRGDAVRTSIQVAGCVQPAELVHIAKESFVSRPYPGIMYIVSHACLLLDSCRYQSHGNPDIFAGKPPAAIRASAKRRKLLQNSINCCATWWNLSLGPKASFVLSAAVRPIWRREREANAFASITTGSLAKGAMVPCHEQCSCAGFLVIQYRFMVATVWHFLALKVYVF